MDERRCEALWASAQALRAALGWHAVPDPSTRWWCSRHQVKPRLRARSLPETTRLCQRLAPPRARTVAVDATGLARAPASPYDQQRAGHRHRATTWLQWSVAVWTAPLVWWGQVAERGPRGDHVACRAWVAPTRARLPCTRRRADGGDDAEANHRWWREHLGLASSMPPVTGRPAQGVPTRPARCQRPRAFPRQADGQWWPVETCISVGKRRLGGAVTARRSWQQVQQTLRRGMTDTLYRAVQWGLSWHLRSQQRLQAAA
jgi:hypothetical protein